MDLTSNEHRKRRSVVFQKNRTIAYLKFKTSSVDTKTKVCLIYENLCIRHNKRILDFEPILVKIAEAFQVSWILEFGN